MQPLAMIRIYSIAGNFCLEYILVYFHGRAETAKTKTAKTKFASFFALLGLYLICASFQMRMTDNTIERSKEMLVPLAKKSSGCVVPQSCFCKAACVNLCSSLYLYTHYRDSTHKPLFTVSLTMYYAINQPA